MIEKEEEEKSKEFNPEICPVCKKTLSLMELKITRCSHLIHMGCYKELLLKTSECPVCSNFMTYGENEQP